MIYRYVYYTDYNVTSDVKMWYNHTITISKFTAFYDPEYRTSYKMNYETDNGNNQFSYNCDEINHDYGQDDCNSDANLPYIYSVINPVINNVPAVGIFLEQNLFGVAIEVVDTTFTFLEN